MCFLSCPERFQLCGRATYLRSHLSPVCFLVVHFRQLPLLRGWPRTALTSLSLALHAHPAITDLASTCYQAMRLCRRRCAALHPLPIPDL